MQPTQLVEQLGGAFSRELGIELSSGKSIEIYKWFLASILFGARISETIAEKTYREFERARLLAPKSIVDAGWDRLVQALDRGGYVRYDFKTATKLQDINRHLLEEYKGDLNALHAAAADEGDLERRLKELGKGIGDVTANIFLRELRGVWAKAAPLPPERVVRAAKELGFVPTGMRDRRRVLETLEQAWRADGQARNTFAEFEAALVRYAIGRKDRLAQ